MRWARRHPIVSGLVGACFLLFILAGILGNHSQKKPTAASTPATNPTAPKPAKHARRKRTPKPHQAAARDASRSVTAAAHSQTLPKSSGLGATRAEFKNANNVVAPPNLAGAPAGLAWYSIQNMSRNGRVTSYTVTENAKPSMSNSERMFLVAGINLPGYPVPIVRQTSTCVDYRVPKLLALLGVEYAEASTMTGTTEATMQAVKAPGC